MNMSSIAFGFLAQATSAVTSAAATVPAEALPWWRESWALWGIVLLTLRL